MSEIVVWETSLDVNATVSQIYDAVKNHRYGTYSAIPHSFFGWTTTAKAGAIATLLDRCPWNGYIAIHFYNVETGGYRLNIPAIGRLLSRKRFDAPAPLAAEHAQALTTIL